MWVVFPVVRSSCSSGVTTGSSIVVIIPIVSHIICAVSLMCLYFFFSSRRRHTRFDCDWSSDVCSSDLNARALIVAILLEELGSSIPAGSLDLATRYLAFLWLAFDPITKRFRNCLSYERQWQEPEGSEDSHGRALWGLGTVLGRSKDAGLRGAAGPLFELAIPAALEVKNPRACSFAL